MLLPEPMRTRVREIRRAFGLLPPDRQASGARFNIDNDNITESGEGLFLRLCARGWRQVIDVGANEGRWTAALRALNEDCHVICFEPHPVIVAHLRSRFQAQESFVQIVEAAAGSEQKPLTLHINNELHSISSIHRATEETTPITVEQTTIDIFCGKTGITHLDCLKIDTEGHELAVLEGAAGMITDNAIDIIQFEFGEYSWNAGTKLRDLYDRLSQKFEIYHLSGDGILGTPYRPEMESFGFSNWIALSRALAFPAE